MQCPECQKEGKKSKVYQGMSTTTLLGWIPYWDEEGKYHNDNPNTTTTEYSCSNGHRWTNVI